MKDDPTITAIREVRHRISASVDHDPRKLVERYVKMQKRHGDRLISHTDSLPQVDVGLVPIADDAPGV